MNLTPAGVGYLSLFAMVLDWLIRIVAIYAMFMAARAFKVYIKKNS